MEVKLIDMDGEYYFSLTINEITSYGASKHISQVLGLDVDKYNKTLIEKVIQYNNYRIEENIYDILYKDVTFKRNSIPDSVYLERFNDVFHKELILFQLGGELND